MKTVTFPLPLTCLEEYMLCDDHPSHPMTIVFRLRFSGPLDRPAFEASLADTVRRHPLLRATVERRRKRTPRWIDNADWQPEIAWDAEVNRYGFPPTGFMDLTKHPGLRVWVVDRDGRQDVHLQVHHSCTDGLGMNIVLEDLLVGYASRLNGESSRPPLRELDWQRFLRRGAPDLTAWRLLKMAHKQAYGLLGVRDFLSHVPAPLAVPAGAIDELAPPPDFPCPFIRELEVSETEAVLSAAKRAGGTVNDLLVRDAFLATGAWRKQRSVGNDEDWLRFSIPMNLRFAADERMSMANSLSSVFLDRQAADFLAPEKLLDGIQRQMSLIKRLQLQYIFILSLGAARWMPGGIGSETRSDQCRLTCWISNLGPVLTHTPLPRRDGRIVCGNVVLDAVDYVIPLRPHVNASVVLHSYAGRMRILLSIDPLAISDEDGRQLLDLYVQQIRQTITDPRSEGR